MQAQSKFIDQMVVDPCTNSVTDRHSRPAPAQSTSHAPPAPIRSRENLPRLQTTSLTASPATSTTSHGPAKDGISSHSPSRYSIMQWSSSSPVAASQETAGTEEGDPVFGHVSYSPASSYGLDTPQSSLYSPPVYWEEALPKQPMSLTFGVEIEHIFAFNTEPGPGYEWMFGSENADDQSENDNTSPPSWSADHDIPVFSDLFLHLSPKAGTLKHLTGKKAIFLNLSLAVRTGRLGILSRSDGTSNRPN